MNIFKLIERNYGKLIIIHLQEKYINKRIQMATNYKESLIKELIKDFSIETTPGVYSKYGKFIELLPNKNDVYVTYLPDENSETSTSWGAR